MYVYKYIYIYIWSYPMMIRVALCGSKRQNRHQGTQGMAEMSQIPMNRHERNIYFNLEYYIWVNFITTSLRPKPIDDG